MTFLKMPVFSSKMLFIQIAQKAKKIVQSDHFRLFRPQEVKIQILPPLNWFIFVQWQLNLDCLTTIIVCQMLNFESDHEFHLQMQFLSLKAAWRGLRSRAELTCISRERIWMIRPLWKWAFSLPPWHISKCFLVFFKGILAQEMQYSMYWVFIIRDNRILNLVVKMTTHWLSSKHGILALLSLRGWGKCSFLKTS